MTWNCDNCGAPNLMEHEHCYRCGRRRPLRYGKVRYKGFIGRLPHNKLTV